MRLTAPLRANEGDGTWQLLDRLARQPSDRDHLRFWRLMYWRHLRDLLRSRVVFRQGRKAVGLTPTAARNGPCKPRRSSMLHDHHVGKPSVVLKNTKKAGSTNEGTARLESGALSKQVQDELVQRNLTLEPERHRTKSTQQSLQVANELVQRNLALEPQRNRPEKAEPRQPERKSQSSPAGISQEARELARATIYVNEEAFNYAACRCRFCSFCSSRSPLERCRA